MTNLYVLTDYLALNNIRFNIRHYPWAIIRDEFNSNYSDHVKNRRLFYTTFTNIGKRSIKQSSTSDGKCNAAMYAHT